MPILIKFDKNNNPIQPTMVLATRNGKKLGTLPAKNIVVKDGLKEGELNFDVYKSKDDVSSVIWDKIVDFKLIWCKEWNTLFEITVDINDSYSPIKNITAKPLGDAELSRLYLHEIEINTENDIARDDYEVTVLYDAENPNASLLSRITEKAPHYEILHVDESIANEQRVFTFDNTSIYEAFQKIEEEIDCVFVLSCYLGSSGEIVRGISVYNSEAYGDNTGIYISVENLTDEIEYSSDTDCINNCFRLSSGDDVMDAAIINCNPNGSRYIWSISDADKSDMSKSLNALVTSYFNQYEKYQTEHLYTFSVTDSSTVQGYNQLVDKYQNESSDYKKILTASDAPGEHFLSLSNYPALMEMYYSTIDFYYYINNSMMPIYEVTETTAENESINIRRLTLSESPPKASVDGLESCSEYTATNAVLSLIKSLVSTDYDVSVYDVMIFQKKQDGRALWAGSFEIKNKSNNEDCAITATLIIEVSDDYATYLRQQISKNLTYNNADKATDIRQLFQLDDTEFSDELKKYCYVRLEAFYEICNSVLNIINDEKLKPSDTEDNEAYNSILNEYQSKKGLIEAELEIRLSEINTINSLKDILIKKRNDTQTHMNMERFFSENLLGVDLYPELASYRRDDAYENSNYISDGLSNSELFSNAKSFLESARKYIGDTTKSSHTISATLKNLLVIKDFAPIVNQFKVGNWIHMKVDDSIFKLKIVDYEIDFENLESISVTFSDSYKVTLNNSRTERTLRKLRGLTLGQNSNALNSVNRITVGSIKK